MSARYTENSEPTLITTALTERKLCHSQNLIRDSNPNFRINLDPDRSGCLLDRFQNVLDSFSHLHESFRQSASDRMRNTNKSPKMVREMEK